MNKKIIEYKISEEKWQKETGSVIIYEDHKTKLVRCSLCNYLLHAALTDADIKELEEGGHIPC